MIVNRHSRSKILSIDPSVNHVGFATLQFVLDPEDQSLSLQWNWGMWELDGFNLLQRCNDLVHRVYEEGHGDATHLICEWPMFYESTKGQIAATEGWTINLAAVACYLAGHMRLTPSNIELVTAPQWKGNQTKAVTARRFFRQFGVNALNVDHNAVDAVMMLFAESIRHGWQNPLSEEELLQWWSVPAGNTDLGT